MNTALSLRSVLLALGALLLLFVLGKLAHVLFTVAAPLLFIWLLASWNHPQRASALFGPTASKGLVRAGLCGAMIVCAMLSSATGPAGSRDGDSGNATRLAQSAEDEGAPASNTNAPPKADAANQVSAREAEERIRVAEARVRQAEAAERKAKRAQEQLARQQREEEQREKRAQEQREGIEKRREAARLAAIPTAPPVDPNTTEKDTFGYNQLRVRVQLSEDGVTFFNDDVFDYTSLSLRLNSGLFTHGYRTTRPLLTSESSLFVPYSDFSQPGGERFSNLTHKVRWVHIYCQTRYGRATWAAQNQS